MQTNLQNVIEYKINIVTILLLKNHIWSCQRIKRDRIIRERIRRERIRRHRREGVISEIIMSEHITRTNKINEGVLRHHSRFLLAVWVCPNVGFSHNMWTNDTNLAKKDNTGWYVNEFFAIYDVRLTCIIFDGRIWKLFTLPREGYERVLDLVSELLTFNAYQYCG